MSRNQWFVTNDRSRSVKLYAHGSCVRNGCDDAVGAGYYYFHPRNPYQRFFTYEGYQSNQVSSLKAVRYGLDVIWENTRFQNVLVVTNSQYVIDCICNNFDRWVSNGWRNSKGREVKNKEEIMNLMKKCCKFKNVAFKRVTDYDDPDHSYYAHAREESLEYAVEAYHWAHGGVPGSLGRGSTNPNYY